MSTSNAGRGFNAAQRPRFSSNVERPRLYFGTRVRGFVHTYDAVRLTADRDAVRSRITFPVEKVIKPARCFVSWMNDCAAVKTELF